MAARRKSERRRKPSHPLNEAKESTSVTSVEGTVTIRTNAEGEVVGLQFDATEVDRIVAVGGGLPGIDDTEPRNRTTRGGLPGLDDTQPRLRDRGSNRSGCGSGKPPPGDSGN
jgi:hypothetical protein